MARRGIRERSYLAINAMPDTALRALYKAAKLEGEMEVPIGSAFPIEWHINNGVDREDVRLAGGDSVRLRFTEAREFIKGKAEVGGIIIPEDLSEEERDAETLRATLKATRARHKFFLDLGLKKVYELMRQANPPRPIAELAVYKTDYFPWLLNEERAQILKKRIPKLVKELEVAEAALAAVVASAE